LNKALFLDRDGVVNVDNGYVHDITSFHPMPQIFELCQKAISQDYIVIIVTNQAGIGRGFYSEEHFHRFTKRVEKLFLSNNVLISKTYYCPHHPQHGLGQYKKKCGCRKPAPGMFHLAKREFSIDMKNSIMIGDNISDLQAANSSGVGTLILVELIKASLNTTFKYNKISSLDEAIQFIY